jgi:hypothetical protein
MDPDPLAGDPSAVFHIQEFRAAQLLIPLYFAEGGAALGRPSRARRTSSGTAPDREMPSLKIKVGVDWMPFF